MGVHRLSVIPRALVDRSNPPPESDDDEGDECLEYDVYGWFKFESDADGVQRLDRQWVPLHDLEQAEGYNFNLKSNILIRSHVLYTPLYTRLN